MFLGVFIAGYFGDLFSRAVHDAWNIYPGRGIGALVVSGAIAMFSIFVLPKYLPGKPGEESKVRGMVWAISVGLGLLAFIILFLVFFLLLSPKGMVEDCRKTLAANVPILDMATAPLVSVDLDFSPSSGSADEVKGVFFRIDCSNNGGSAATDVICQYNIGGKTDTIEAGMLVPHEQSRTFYPRYDDETIAMLYKGFALQKWTVKCSVTYGDMADHQFQIDYEWTGNGIGGALLAPRRYLKGDYKKLKSPVHP